MEWILGLGIVAILSYACFEVGKLVLGDWRRRRSIASSSDAWAPGGGTPTAWQPTARRPVSEADLIDELDRVLPPWPISEIVLDASHELLRLQRDIGLALDAGVPVPLVERLIAAAALAADGLKRPTERVLAVAAMASESGDPAHAPEMPAALHDELAAETERLTHLVDAIRAARAGLAELTVADDVGQEEVARATRRFRALGETAEELTER